MCSATSKQSHRQRRPSSFIRASSEFADGGRLHSTASHPSPPAAASALSPPARVTSLGTPAVAPADIVRRPTELRCRHGAMHMMDVQSEEDAALERELVGLAVNAACEGPALADGLTLLDLANEVRAAAATVQPGRPRPSRDLR